MLRAVVVNQVLFMQKVSTIQYVHETGLANTQTTHQSFLHMIDH